MCASRAQPVHRGLTCVCSCVSHSDACTATFTLLKLRPLRLQTLPSDLGAAELLPRLQILLKDLKSSPSFYACRRLVVSWAERSSLCGRKGLGARNHWQAHYDSLLAMTTRDSGLQPAGVGPAWLESAVPLIYPASLMHLTSRWASQSSHSHQPRLSDVRRH